MALHSFSSRNPLFLGSVFQLFIRPSLEYVSSVWSSSLKQDIQTIVRVLRWFSKYIPPMSEKKLSGETKSNGFNKFQFSSRTSRYETFHGGSKWPLRYGH